jgi:hypothetical protein
MKDKLLSVTLLLVFFSASILAQDAKPTIDSFSWLAGCWTNADKGAVTTLEQWQKPAGGMMFGIGRTIKEGKIVSYELTRIYQEADGTIFFSAKLPKQDEVAFKLIKSAGGEFVFENAAHDFPQRVIYRQEKNGDLAGRIEGKNNGKDMGFDFPFKRVGCE